MSKIYLFFFLFVAGASAVPVSSFRFENRTPVPVYIDATSQLGDDNFPVRFAVPAGATVSEEVPGFLVQADLAFDFGAGGGLTVIFGSDTSNSEASSVCLYNREPTGLDWSGVLISSELHFDGATAYFYHTRVPRPADTGRLLLALTLGTFFGSLLLLPLRYAS